MSTIDFISHEEFPEDEYTKELVYLCLDSKYRVVLERSEHRSDEKWTKRILPGFHSGQQFP